MSQNSSWLFFQIIAELTLFFDEGQTELAIGLTLTIMLVMYTMYQSITAALATTAYLKMIDYWLIFCLIIPLVIFFTEIYWFIQKKKEPEETKGWVTSEKFSWLTKRKAQQLAIPVVTFLFMFFYFITALVLAFI